MPENLQMNLVVKKFIFLLMRIAHRYYNPYMKVQASYHLFMYMQPGLCRSWSKTPQTGLKFYAIFSVDNVLKDLSGGTRMNKVKGGGILYTRHFYLDTDSMKLLYTGSQKRFRKKNTSCK